MIGISLFLNSKIEGHGLFNGIGNLALAPCRYLFGGRTIRIIGKDVHYVAAFHPNGERNISTTLKNFHSSSRNMLKAAIAVVLVVPGLIIGIICKIMGALTLHGAEMYKKVIAVMPTNDWEWQMKILNIRILGSREAPLTNAVAVSGQIRNSVPADVFIVYGKGFEIHAESDILQKNPMKLILIGPTIAKTASERIWRLDSRAVTQLDSAINKAGKWVVKSAKSIEEALQDQVPLRSRLLCKRWHVVYMVPAGEGSSSSGTTKIHTL